MKPGLVYLASRTGANDTAQLTALVDQNGRHAVGQGKIGVSLVSVDEERGVIWLAVAQPADLSRQDEMSFALGKPVEL